MIRNPKILIFVIIELLDRLDDNRYPMISIGVNIFATVFVCINHQVKVINHGNKIVHPLNINTGVKFRFDNIKTT